MTRTLWPEQQKLYGHAFEVFCLATSHKGDCAASACKAKEKLYADIIIWNLQNTNRTVPTCKLAGFNLTVVQLEFSKCDQYLLACSRDRSWVLYKR
jgi:elongator complex protein 2